MLVMCNVEHATVSNMIKDSNHQFHFSGPQMHRTNNRVQLHLVGHKMGAVGYLIDRIEICHIRPKLLSFYSIFLCLIGPTVCF